MKKRLVSIVVAIIVLATNITFAFDSKVYYNDISVGLISMMSENISIRVNGNYRINGQTIPSGTTYVLKFNEGKIEFNGQLVDSILLEPLNSETTVTISRLNSGLNPIITRNYQGRFLFKLEGKEIIPINIIDLERYLLGVVPYEMSDSFHIEALKAQAVAARTYALYSLGKYKSRGFDVCDTTATQVYRGFNPAFVNSKKAVDETKGMILLYNNQVIGAFFHASNGGYTELVQNVWTASLPYFNSVRDDFSVTNWPGGDRSFTIGQIEQNLKTRRFILETDTLTQLDLDSIELYPSGRIKNIKAICMDEKGAIKEVDLVKERLRIALGLPSNLYTITYDESTQTYLFSGKGFGHGIGLSQIGARNRANAGQNFITILNFYYPGVSIRRVASNIRNINLSKSQIYTNENIDITVDTLSVGNVVYRYEVEKDSRVVYRQDNTQSNSFSFKPLVDGDYTVKVYVKDSRANDFEDIKTVSFKVLPRQISGISNSFRVYGDNRILTSVAVSQKGWNTSDYAIITRSDDFPDALAAGVLARKYDAPILLTNKNSLDINIENEILRLGVKNVFIIGGEEAVSTSVENRIKSFGINVDRISGKNRYETSVEIAKRVGNKGEVFIATGENFPDALSISSIAGIKEAPIILVNKTNADIALEYIRSNEISKIYVVGGENVVPSSILNEFEDKIERLAGENRYKTNIEVGNRFRDIINNERVYIATGENFPDALSGSSLAAKDNSMIILLSPNNNTILDQQIVNRFNSNTYKYILGGESVVSTNRFLNLFK
ncbi:SpoIID/LytB domain protein [Alkalithermobacter thermoalcaliphilus JW-YL-7 = DSM 7308]|uniref:SpoIID/LytB domain protein n=1 Tax=Alkalithermobacter thermoalcaliphilus JW-YL-7 = DSM 7308 TaxID=1121328 RepID=A0A150FTK1_CLOPD|nr:SpoIID/LytB domain protein [[Clostridium] paradoxum JW-YL-7 = DSM 7308]SHK72614.1 SpoIID/LytB domain protein [[Clostridium] paradoxum JW-YL-7 = DSM 7308]